MAAPANSNATSSGSQASRIFVVFKLENAQTEWGESLRVVGSSKEIGSWSPYEAVSLSTDAKHYPSWQSPEVQFVYDARREDMEGCQLTVTYKYVRDRRCFGEGFQWEDRIGNRQAVIRLPRFAGTSGTSVWLVTDTAFDKAGCPSIEPMTRCGTPQSGMRWPERPAERPRGCPPEEPRQESEELPRVATPCRWSASSPQAYTNARSLATLEYRRDNRVSMEAMFADASDAYGCPEAQQDTVSTRRKSKQRQPKLDPWSVCWTYCERADGSVHLQIDEKSLDVSAAEAESRAYEEWAQMLRRMKTMFEVACAENRRRKPDGDVHGRLGFTKLRTMMRAFHAEELVTKTDDCEEQLLQFVMSKPDSVLSFDEFYIFVIDKAAREPTFGRRLSFAKLFQLAQDGAPGFAHLGVVSDNI